MRKNNVSTDVEEETPKTARVLVGTNFHQFRRGDDMIVQITPFTQALIDSGTFKVVN